MSEISRPIAITAGLIVAGAVAGAVVAALPILGLALALGSRTDWGNVGFLVTIAGGIGAALGGLLGPLCTWKLLPHVPLGRVIALTSLGALIGGSVGLALLNAFWLMPVIGAVAGFGIAVSHLARASVAPDAGEPAPKCDAA